MNDTQQRARTDEEIAIGVLVQLITIMVVDMLKDEKNAGNCAEIIQETINSLLKGATTFEEIRDRIPKAADDKEKIIRLFHEIENKRFAYVAVLHGKATDAIARMSGSKPTPNPLNNTASIESGEVKLIIKSLDTLSGTLGVSTHKLLMAAIAGFTELNHTGTGKDRSLRGAKVSIPLKDFAITCGYDVIEHSTDTP